MRIVLVAFCVALAACGTDRNSDAQFSGEATRAAEQQAQQRCASEGKRARLINVFDNSDGSRRYEYQCVQ